MCLAGDACFCDKEARSPVCASGGRTFNNTCEATCEGFLTVTPGECGESLASCHGDGCLGHATCSITVSAPTSAQGGVHNAGCTSALVALPPAPPLPPPPAGQTGLPGAAAQPCVLSPLTECALLDAVVCSEQCTPKPKESEVALRPLILHGRRH
jgi:hypothetical protein